MRKVELTWEGKAEPVAEPTRPLRHLPALDYGERGTGNMLIQGDNLAVLRALAADFAGRIRCIYLDPPYNIRAANEHYRDFVEPAAWLSFMRERLLALRPLLADDGVIFAQIDKEQSAYLKILMDEVFGRENFVTTIAVRMSATSGYKIEHADKTIVKNVEFLHVYSRSLRMDFIYEEAPYDSHYAQILHPVPGREGLFTLAPLTAQEEVRACFAEAGLPPVIRELPRLYELSERFRCFVAENRQRVGRLHTAPAAVREDAAFLAEALPDGNHVVKRRYGADEYYIRRFARGCHQFIPIALKFRRVETAAGYRECLSNILGDWWDDFYLDMGNVAREGGTAFRNSKKPERLLLRIISNFTRPGDYVLDAFLGSGTTAAVAHKLGRRYIGIEMGEHCRSLCKPRLERVVDGDASGVSAMAGWKGGGGFSFYELGAC